MAKYHIGRDGLPHQCHAKKGKCPFGSPDEHYSSSQEAEKAAQSLLEQENGFSPVDASYDNYAHAEYSQWKENSTERLGLTHQDISSILSGLDETGGATFNLHGDVPTKGYAASPYPEHSKVYDSMDSFDEKTIQEYVDSVNKEDNAYSNNNNFVGIWKDPSDGKIYLDVSSVYSSKEEALKISEEHDQIAFWDFENCTEVVVNPDAKSGQE